jgi:hypothetical protein
MRIFNLSVIGAAMVMMGLTAAVNAGKPAADIPLLVSFSSGETDALTHDGFLAPGYAANYAHGAENVLAIIQPSGNFRFGTQNNLNAAALRRMCVDFGAQFADRGLTVPFVDGNPRQCVNVAQPMLAYAVGDVSIASLRYGQSVEKLTRFTWDDGSYRYRIGYGTDMDMNGVMDSPSVRVTCISPADSTAQCTTWVLAPSGDGSAALFRFNLTSKRGAVQEGAPEFMTQVVMPFAQTFSRKQ